MMATLTITTEEKLTAKFYSLNKKYVKISKQMDKVARTQCTLDLENQLDKIQSQMSIISAKLETIN